MQAPILPRNPNRIAYSIQNVDAANYVAVSSKRSVTAGTLGVDEGQHIIAGQSVNDTDDKDEVWIIANTAAVNVAVLEVTEVPEVMLRPLEKARIEDIRRPAMSMQSRVSGTRYS